MAKHRSAPATHEASPVADDSSQSGIDVLQDHWLEFITVLLLATASLAAAWGGYQSARWGGVQSTLYSKAGAVRVESTRSQTQSQFLALTDLSIQNACADASSPASDTVRGRIEDVRAELRADQRSCYNEQFTGKLRSSVASWDATQSILESDTADGASQVDAAVRREAVESTALEAEASRLFVEGQAANQQSDDYVLTTVFLATVLFFGGVSSQITWRTMRLAFVAFAMTLLGFSLWRLATFPVM